VAIITALERVYTSLYVILQRSPEKMINYD